MARIGIKEAFAKYGASLRNIQWSVSAWAPDGSLVVSLWEHHRRKSPPGTLEFEGSVSRWKGPGNSEFRENVATAFASKSKVRLVIVRTEEVGRVEAGEDASAIKKDFHLKEEVIGQVIEWDGEHYAFRFTRA
jgi:hypothetical protein